VDLSLYFFYGIYCMCEVISEKYALIDKIGSGSFGEVYLTKHINGEYVASKVEERVKESRIKMEYKIYRSLHKSNKGFGLPKIYSFAETPSFYIMFMQLLGPSLEDMLDKYNRQLKVYTVLTLGEQLINIMEHIHEAGFIHRDIKPNNFLIGINENNSQVYITDFGLSKRYIKNNKHMQFRNHRSLIGTARYASINMHLGEEPSRRDDLESIGYMLVYLLKGSLPWQGLKKKGKKKDYLQRIGAKKMSVSLSKLCENLPNCFEKYILYCRNLNFDETPDYNSIRNMFIDERQRQNLPYLFEWYAQ
jgi:serine/threonine protein kinase